MTSTPVSICIIWTQHNLCRRNLECGYDRFLLLGALLIDRESEEVSVAADREHKLVVKTARQLSDDTVVVIMYWQAPVGAHETRVIVMNGLDADAAVRHSKHQVLRAVNGDRTTARLGPTINEQPPTLALQAGAWKCATYMIYIAAFAGTLCAYPRSTRHHWARLSANHKK